MDINAAENLRAILALFVIRLLFIQACLNSGIHVCIGSPVSLSTDRATVLYFAC